MKVIVLLLLLILWSILIIGFYAGYIHWIACAIISSLGTWAAGLWIIFGETSIVIKKDE